MTKGMCIYIVHVLILHIPLLQWNYISGNEYNVFPYKYSSTCGFTSNYVHL